MRGEIVKAVKLIHLPVDITRRLRVNLLKCVHHLILADRERQFHAAFIARRCCLPDRPHILCARVIPPVCSCFFCISSTKPGLHRALSIRAYFRTAWLPPAPVSHRGADSARLRSDGSVPGPACSSHWIVTALAAFDTNQCAGAGQRGKAEFRQTFCIPLAESFLLGLDAPIITAPEVGIQLMPPLREFPAARHSRPSRHDICPAI